MLQCYHGLCVFLQIPMRLIWFLSSPHPWCQRTSNLRGDVGIVFQERDVGAE